MADVTLAIFDTQGRLVVSKYIRKVSSGSILEIEIPYVGGTCILKVADGKFVFTKPFMDVHQ